MKRIIKVRIWYKPNKFWLDADSFPLNHDLYGHYILFREDYIFQQYTGLKDKNGKEICEGDIVENNSYGITSIQIVQWDDAHACFKLSCDSNLEMLQNTNILLKVIGNIFENPELLKK